jgi:hypothetical protein
MTTARLAPTARIEWRRPIIMDITPNRPTPEQADARRREVKKRWRRKRERRGEDKPEKPEDLRLGHLRWRELLRLLRRRYGTVMPDTLEARRDLEILINYALLTGKKPRHIVEIWAPWLDQDEADHLAAHQRPILHRADDLARKLDLRYCDRQALAITTIGAIDVDQAERDRRRCQRRNEAKRQKRAAKPECSTMETNTAVAPARTAPLTARQRKVLAKIDGAEINVPELIRSVARLKEFQKLASPRQEVHRVLDHLVAVGLVADRDEPNPQGGKVRFVWRQQ